MKVIILGGFLGSGKTSVLLQLARYIAGDTSGNSTKVVILENEIGEVSVDDSLLKRNGYQVTNLFSGCVCCTMSGELILNLRKIRDDFNPELVIMEATGVAFPDNIRQTINQSLPELEVAVTCITDAKRWLRLLRPMEMLLEGQLEAAEVILINKIDMVDSPTLADVEASIRTFNNGAEFFKISAARPIDPLILGTILNPEQEKSINE
ncbi:MAG: GTP-binding protein [Acetobacterium sp.]|uniref:GTP-binding protein n=1 Tax=Acetobacterium sp. TaxID=1872094 RepID=UPI0032424CE0